MASTSTADGSEIATRPSSRRSRRMDYGCLVLGAAAVMTVAGVVLGGLARLVEVVDVVARAVVVDVVDGGGAVAAAPGTAATSTPAPAAAITGLAAGTLAGRTAGGGGATRNSLRP